MELFSRTVCCLSWLLIRDPKSSKTVMFISAEPMVWWCFNFVIYLDAKEKESQRFWCTFPVFRFVRVEVVWLYSSYSTSMHVLYIIYIYIYVHTWLCLYLLNMRMRVVAQQIEFLFTIYHHLPSFAIIIIIIYKHAI